MDALLKDLRYALRGLARGPGFAAVAVLSIGLGVGVNTAMFSLVDALLFRPLPVESPGTLVDVFTSSRDGDEYATSSYPDFLDLKAQSTVFADLIGYSPMFAPLSLGDRSRLVAGQVVTANYFDVLGIRPSVGRLLVASDDDPAAPRVVVIADRMWRREFGARADIVGRTLVLRGLPYTIVGVVPASFTGVVPLLVPELWVPMAVVEEVEPAGIIDNVPSPAGRTRLERRGMRWMFVKGRLKDGVTAAQARANVALIANQLEAAHPQTNKNRRMAVVPTSDVRFLVPQAGAPMAVGSAGVMAVVGLVLLIACANVAGLLIARATARRREVSVRLAIGATRRRLIQQWLAEGLVLGALGSIAAAGSAWMLVRALAAVRLPLPADLSLALTVDARVLIFAVMVALTAGLAASLLPALKASSWNLAGDLRGDRPAARVAGRRVALADALVIAQVALTSVLLVTAGLLLRSLGESERADVGFRTNDLAVVSFETDMVRYSSEKGEQFWREAVARVRALPGVLSVATASSIPFELNFSWTDMRMDNRAYADGATGDVIEYRNVSPGYLETIGVRLVEGRDVTEADRRGGPLVALVNQTMARTYWPGESALGHSFRVAATNDQYVIVGVFADHKRHNVLEAPAPLVHFASAQRPSTFRHLIVRATGSPDITLAAVRRELLGMEPNLVFVNNATLERTIGTSLLPARVGAMLAAGFGGLGTLLAAIGLYGVVAFSVARRTREIGVRVALGARPREVLAMVLRQGFALVALGLGIGALLASAAAQGLSGLLFGVAPLDPSAWALAAATMTVAAALATLVPARRAMRVDPVTTLRAE